MAGEKDIKGKGKDIEAIKAELAQYKKLGSLDDLKGLKGYSQFGTVEELKERLAEADMMAEELEAIKAGLLKAFPASGRLVEAEKAEDERLDAYVESSVDTLKELADKAGIKADTDDDMYYLASLVTAHIQKDPKELKKYAAGDLKIVEKAFEFVSERFYGKKRPPKTNKLPKAGVRHTSSRNLVRR